MTGLSHIAQSERSDVESLENENDERTHRTQLEDAITEHRRLIKERVPQKSGRKIDESLWWWVQ